MYTPMWKIVRIEGENAEELSGRFTFYTEIIDCIKKDGFEIIDKSSDSFYESYRKPEENSTKSLVLFFTPNGTIITSTPIETEISGSFVKSVAGHVTGLDRPTGK